MVGDPGNADRTRRSVIAIDVAALMPVEAFKRRVDGLAREIREAPKARGAERIYLPGEMEWERRERACGKGSCCRRTWSPASRAFRKTWACH